MKLAEALLEKAAINTRMSELRDLVVQNGFIQEGDTPIDDANDTLKEFEECYRKLVALERKIIRTNSETTVNNLTLSQLIGEKKMLKTKSDQLKKIIDSCKTNNRYSRSEIKHVVIFDLKKLVKENEAITASIRKIEMTLAQTNWQTELLE